MKTLFLRWPALGAFVLLSACASQPEDIPAVYISDKAYQGDSCSELDAKLETNAMAASQLQYELKNKANVDMVQAGLTVLFLPFALTLEGGDGEDAREYARLQGERKALVFQVQEKNCDINLAKTDVYAKACDPARGEKCPPAAIKRLPLVN